MKEKQRLLIATDVPFWRKSSGARQRILALVRFFVANGIDVTTFYLGRFNATDEQQINESALDVRHAFTDNPPRGMIRRAAWHAAGTVNLIKNIVGRNSADVPASNQKSSDQALTLEDFRWPWAAERFSRLVDELRPDFVLIEYVKMAYLAEAIPDTLRATTCVMIDTHDVLHSRAQQFAERGFRHWLAIDREQESTALRQFDVIIAIQPGEAQLFREMAPQSRTIVAGHSLEHAEQPLPVERRTAVAKSRSSKTVIGYFGSANFSNWSAINRFLREVWPALSARHSELNLLIAGTVCKWLTSGPPPEHMSSATDNAVPVPVSELPRIVTLDHVNRIRDFYDQVDIVINPVEFGTGLKIKNCEALWFGKPLVTTVCGSDCLPEGSEPVVLTVEEIGGMTAAISQLVSSPELLASMQEQAGQIGRSLFSDQHAYRELKELLNTVDSR